MPCVYKERHMLDVYDFMVYSILAHCETSCDFAHAACEFYGIAWVMLIQIAFQLDTF